MQRLLPLLLAVLATAAALQEGTDGPGELTKPAPAIPIEPGSVELEDYECASCHAEVALEWAESAHALAWVDEAYRKSLKKKRRPASCHGCHAPEPLFATGSLEGGRPPVRADRRELGVHCETCHLGAGDVVLGPRGTPTDAHASELSPLQTLPGSNGLCAACHATDIGPVIGLADDVTQPGATCVGCHMAPVTRAWADDAPERTGRSHALQTPRDPAFLRRAFELTWEADTLVIANRAGHRVPGLVGRRITFTASVLDASGVELERAEAVLDTDAYLPAAGTYELPLQTSGATLHVTGLHEDPRQREPVEFLDLTLPAGR